jgi:uncharacterized membrane protein (DUF106 family)
MLSKLLSSVLMHLVSSVVNAITDWLRQKELEALRDRARTLEAQIKSMKESGADEKKIEDAAAKARDADARAHSITDKLKNMAMDAEAMLESSNE